MVQGLGFSGLGFIRLRGFRGLGFLFRLRVYVFKKAFKKKVLEGFSQGPPE